MESERYWFATADNRRVSLFVCTRLPSGDLHVEQVRTLQNANEDIHEHHRPCFLSRGPSANAALRLASLGHEEEEEHKRFARVIGDWLGEATRELRLRRVSVFAASGLMGLLRDRLDGAANPLHERELTRLRPDQLARHPAVLNVIFSEMKQLNTARR